MSWKRLGSFSFDSNERSKLQARELKSVTVNVQALFVRIVLARCHTNSQNVYGQVAPFLCPRRRTKSAVSAPDLPSHRMRSSKGPFQSCAI